MDLIKVIVLVGHGIAMYSPLNCLMMMYYYDSIIIIRLLLYSDSEVRFIAFS